MTFITPVYFSKPIVDNNFNLDLAQDTIYLELKQWICLKLFDIL